MKSLKRTADVIKLKVTLKWLNNIFNLIRLKYGRSLPDIDITDALNWLIQTINGLVTKLSMNSSVLDIVFNEFIKALPSRLVRLLDNAS